MATEQAWKASEPEIAREVIRVYERYAVEVVERFDLCPWAERARQAGRVEPRVLFDSDPSHQGSALEAITQLASDERVEVGLLLFPCLDIGRRDFEHYLRILRQTDSERYEPGLGPFAMAAFHPDAEADLGHADRLVPFIRRSPDPTIQLVRKSLLDELNGSTRAGTSFLDIRRLADGLGGAGERETVSLRKWVAERNLTTIRESSVATLEAIFEDIEADRRQSYARLGLPPTPRAHPR